MGKPREILFEFVRQGAFVKVSAVDAETGIEAAIVGPASAGQEALKRTATRKLEYVLTKQAGKG